MPDSEFEIIRRHFSESGLDFPRPGVELGIGDDAALLALPQDKLLAMSVDVLVQGVHFPMDADPALIACRALAVNLSDMAAMAAEPLCFTLGLVLSSSDEQWLQSFSSGLLQIARKYNCPLVGGDTTCSRSADDPLIISIQVQGLCESDRVSRRSGATVGDRIYVSGKLGDGAIALASLGLKSHLGESFSLQHETLPDSCKQYFLDAYYRPVPRIELAAACAELVNSCIDLSDGLIGDLSHILKASGVGAKLLLSELPFSDSARCCMSEQQCIRAALYGGDDYELCFTVPQKTSEKFERLASQLGEQVSCIGEIEQGREIRCLAGDGSGFALEDYSYQHFRSNHER